MINEDVALLYGLLLGDGCLSKVGKHSFVSIVGNFYSDEPSMIKIAGLIEKIRNKPTAYYKREKHGKLEICISDKELFNFIKNLGFPVGKKGTHLIIPITLKNDIKNVIKGYFATDGCFLIINNNGIKYPRLEFSSISKPLLEQLKGELEILGIHGNVYLSKIYKNNWNALYRLQINGRKNLFKFKEIVGFFNPKHEIRFNRFIEQI